MGTKQELLRAIKAIAPPLTFEAHKGTSGRIGIVGGSLEYTGAPYFAAITAMRAGADLAHVFCPESAASVIKSYSPDLIVHPLLSGDADTSSSAISAWFPRLHSLVIGPGLGRDPAILGTVKKLLQTAKDQHKNIIIDADGLFLITSDPSLVMGYAPAILTPNAAEFRRLMEKMKCTSNEQDIESETKELAKSMGGVTVLRKGKTDVISNGNHVISCEEQGCPRRCGGQGDLLSGSLGLFVYWASQAESRLGFLNDITFPMLAAYSASVLVKRCATHAYARHRRAMLASDLVPAVEVVARELFDE